jgi:2-amino-4-hydroxy-6-hydroxymethyldihydropteridine diphosphokinase
MSEPHAQRAYIGLGSNLSNPKQQLLQALEELRHLPETTLETHSSLYRSDPVGPPGQPDYINAVVLLKTCLSPLTLLDELQALEQGHNRVRKIHWGPRTLDLDILLYGDRTIKTDRLSVPHPFMPERNFVLYPLAEITQDLLLPDGNPLQNLLAVCPMGTLERLDV